MGNLKRSPLFSLLTLETAGHAPSSLRRMSPARKREQRNQGQNEEPNGEDGIRRVTGFRFVLGRLAILQ